MAGSLHLALTTGMLVFTGTGVCCAVAGNRRQPGQRSWVHLSMTGNGTDVMGVFWMLIMLVAMADIALSSVALQSDIGWALFLILAGPFSSALSARTGSRFSDASQRAQMDLHRGLSMLAMGSLIPFVHSGGEIANIAMGHAHNSMSGTGQSYVILVGIAAYIAFTLWVASRLRGSPDLRHRRRSHFLEAVSSAAAVVCMAAMAA